MSQGRWGWPTRPQAYLGVTDMTHIYIYVYIYIYPNDKVMVCTLIAGNYVFLFLVRGI